MKRKSTYFFVLLALLLSGQAASAQSQEEQERKMEQMIQKEVDRYENLLDLEYWQVFYVDSILTHNYNAMVIELDALNKAKVSNADIYQQIQDKWMEESYKAFNAILSEDQWQKYLKTGGARDKKARDKRTEKRKK